MKIANWADQCAEGVTEYRERDFWTADSFEDNVDRLIIGLYESAVVSPQRGAIPTAAQNLVQQDLPRIRRIGAFVPAPDRLVTNYSDSLGIPKGLRPPSEGCVAMSGWHKLGITGKDLSTDPRFNPEYLRPYCEMVYFRRLHKFPTFIQPRGMGSPYEMLVLYPQDAGGIWGARLFFTLSSQWKAQGCVNPTAAKKEPSANLAELLFESLQWQDDMRHQWVITAQDESTKVSLGAYPDAVKSLLYARSFPLTKSGRKRPILHLVRAHKRRVKEGIDLEISEFLRGTREVIMDGVRFSVSASETLLSKLALQ